MKALVLITLIMLLPVRFMAQEVNPEQDKDYIDIESAEGLNTGSETESAGPAVKKTDIDLSMGTSFMTYGKNSYSSLYISPAVTYRFNPKFSVRAGITLINSYPLNAPANEDITYYGLNPPPKNSLFVFAQGQYNFNSRLNITGTAYKQFSAGYGPQLDRRINNAQYNLQGMSLGINYQLSENVHIGAQFNFVNQSSPYFGPYPGAFNYNSSPLLPGW